MRLHPRGVTLVKVVSLDEDRRFVGVVSDRVEPLGFHAAVEDLDHGRTTAVVVDRAKVALGPDL